MSVKGESNMSQDVRHVPLHFVIASVVWNRRRVARIKQATVCRVLGLGQTGYSKFERGRTQLNATKFFLLDYVLGRDLHRDIYTLHQELIDRGYYITPNGDCTKGVEIEEVRAIASAMSSSPQPSSSEQQPSLPLALS